jgi:hypothetical protein
VLQTVAIDSVTASRCPNFCFTLLAIEIGKLCHEAENKCIIRNAFDKNRDLSQRFDLRKV